MLGYIGDLILRGLKHIAGWLLDLFVWFFEWMYSVVSEFLQWLFDLMGEVALSVLEGLSGIMPEGLVDAITGTYEWLKYVDDWVPIKFGLGLLCAYFAIMVALAVLRWVLRLIPGLGG